jgi:hypothetical protein
VTSCSDEGKANQRLPLGFMMKWSHITELWTSPFKIVLHYNEFPGSWVSQMTAEWGVSYKYTNICRVQLKFLHNKTQENTASTYMAICIYIYIYISIIIHAICRNDESYNTYSFTKRAEWMCVKVCFGAILILMFPFARLLRSDGKLLKICISI